MRTKTAEMVGGGLKLALWGGIILLGAPVQAFVIRFFPKQSGFLPLLVHHVFTYLFGLTIRQKGERPRKGPVLIVANHLSWLDIFIIGSVLPVSFVAKAEIASWPVARWMAALQRTLFIDRERRSATAKTNADMAERLQSGDSLVLFAEGTTGDGVKPLPLKASLIGAAVLAAPALPGGELVLQPLALVYRRRGGLPLTRREKPLVAWYGDMGLMSHLKTFLRESALDVDVVWGNQVLFNGTSNRKEAAKTLEKEILKGFFEQFQI